jgi:N-hydroxyarylamine O-acetyltransferase
MMNAKDEGTVDIGRYRRRIDSPVHLDTSLDTLTRLIEHHLASIPFENIDVLLDRGIDLSPQAVDAKLIDRRRGGYCYEHNGLFKRVLAAIGFDVVSLAARVVWMVPEESRPLPRTHMALAVTLDQDLWLVDVGFGGNVPTAPLRLSQTGPQETRHGSFRVVAHSKLTVVETLVEGHWQPLYELSQDPLLDVDYEPLNWFISTHPTSMFRKNLMVARTTSEARYSLMNNRLTIRHRGQPVERRNLAAEELERTLADEFGLPVETDWMPLLRRIALQG